MTFPTPSSPGTEPGGESIHPFRERRAVTSISPEEAFRTTNSSIHQTSEAKLPGPDFLTAIRPSIAFWEIRISGAVEHIRSNTGSVTYSLLSISTQWTGEAGHWASAGRVAGSEAIVAIARTSVRQSRTTYLSMGRLASHHDQGQR